MGLNEVTMKNGTRNNGTPYPYYSHTTPIRCFLQILEIVWEAYHKGGPMSLGVPGIILEQKPHGPHGS